MDDPTDPTRPEAWREARRRQRQPLDVREVTLTLDPLDWATLDLVRKAAGGRGYSKAIALAFRLIRLAGLPPPSPK